MIKTDMELIRAGETRINDIYYSLKDVKRILKFLKQTNCTVGIVGLRTVCGDNPKEKVKSLITIPLNKPLVTITNFKLEDGILKGDIKIPKEFSKLTDEYPFVVKMICIGNQYVDKKGRKRWKDFKYISFDIDFNPVSFPENKIAGLNYT